jgi:hypothetical protein
MQDDAVDHSAAVTGTDFGVGQVSPLRRRMLWLLAGAIVVAAGFAATSVVRRLQADQALHNVAKAAAIAVAAPEPAWHDPARVAPLPAPGAAAAVGTQAAAGGLPAPVQAQEGASAPAPAIPDVDKTATGAGDSRRAAKGDDASTMARTGRAAPAVDADTVAQRPRARDRHRGTAARAEKRGDAAERKTASRRAARGSDTFKRCPPLGKKGAVMCRWHICNGAAGKERACRPYLERKP